MGIHEKIMDVHDKIDNAIIEARINSALKKENKTKPRILQEIYSMINELEQRVDKLEEESKRVCEHAKCLRTDTLRPPGC